MIPNNVKEAKDFLTLSVPYNGTYEMTKVKVNGSAVIKTVHSIFY